MYLSPQLYRPHVARPCYIQYCHASLLPVFLAVFFLLVCGSGLLHATNVCLLHASIPVLRGQPQSLPSGFRGQGCPDVSFVDSLHYPEHPGIGPVWEGVGMVFKLVGKRDVCCMCAGSVLGMCLGCVRLCALIASKGEGGVLALGSADLFLDDCFGIPAGREDLTERSKA